VKPFNHLFKSVCVVVILATSLQTTPTILNADENGASALPAGYVDELVAGLGAGRVPTGIRPLPDGRILVTVKSGQLYAIENGSLNETPLLDLAGQICNDFERGLQSVAVDPAFTSNGYLYVFYTWNGGKGNCGVTTNRVVRYTLQGNTTSAPLVILDGIASPQGNHNGGDLHFGADGLLYISVGDGGKEISSNGSGGSNTNARNRAILNGKILRINKDGSIPASNPFVNEAGSVVCGGNPVNLNGGVCQETYAWGLRNPFKFAFNASGDAFHINDVGQGIWEEINVGASGADYGWNTREGKCVNGSTSNCPAPTAGMTDPIYAYGRGVGCSITGGAFSDAAWAGLENRYFFGDYCSNKLFILSANGSAHSEFHTPSVAGKLVAMHFDPATRSLYYTLSESYAGTGTQQGVLRRVRYAQAANRPPAADARSNINYGPLPLTVQFDASLSSDPDGEALSYGWQFSDGSTSADVKPSFTFSDYGVFTVTLVVTDARGARSTPALQRIYPGNTPPEVKFTLDAQPFRVGQVLTASAVISDAEDGALPASAASWRVLVHHVSANSPGTRHTHPYFSGSGLSVTLPPMPGPEDLDAAAGSFLEVQLSVADQNGLTHVVTQTLQPRRVTVRLASQPGGLSLRANERTVTATGVISGWQGMTLTLAAPALQPLTRTAWAQFDGWEHGGGATHDVALPGQVITYTARYKTIITRIVLLPIIRR
jgi:glucose/arabinose dehydrogenase